jgi:NADH-quinone oxidoreductase subunit L
VANYFWLIPLFPLAAAGILAITPKQGRKLATALSIGAIGIAFCFACAAFAATLQHGTGEGPFRQTINFPWLTFGADAVLRLGVVLDPLAGCMLVMVTFVGALIFIYSVGYMAHDDNFTRFFCFLSLFAAAMLGVVIANSLLLLFMCWELVGLASYLLIGFWYFKPSAAAAAKKAFIVTRIGDLGLFLGMLWLYSGTGTLIFYDAGNGCLEAPALARLVTSTVFGGMAVSTAIALLIFWGAMGKSGQVPLHVWLPDAMEGPTPVSALIHAATMVAAGVFLVARVYPLMDADAANVAQYSTALSVVAWVGSITAVFAALIAVAQFDIKRILAYSTVSQLGYMMMGIGVGGYAIGMFHLISHAFFKALLFLGAGSVIHGCHERQDIREMGGLRRLMPITFATYAVGMMALSGVPLLFSGFWSKDEILHSASAWKLSSGPFYLGLFGALLTAFYMTRQMWYVFFSAPHVASSATDSHRAGEVHESPPVMTVPLAVLAAFTILLGIFGTPFWPWFHDYVSGTLDHLHASASIPGDVLLVMIVSTAVVAFGITLAWWLYSRRGKERADTLERLQPDVFALLNRKFFVDELYDATVVRWNAFLARASDWLDRWIWDGAVRVTSLLVLGASWLNRFIDEFVVNLGFDKGCQSVRHGGQAFSFLQNGQAQRYLRLIALSVAVLGLLFVWGCR